MKKKLRLLETTRISNIYLPLFVTCELHYFTHSLEYFSRKLKTWNLRINNIVYGILYSKYNNKSKQIVFARCLIDAQRGEVGGGGKHWRLVQHTFKYTRTLYQKIFIFNKINWQRKYYIYLQLFKYNKFTNFYLKTKRTTIYYTYNYIIDTYKCNTHCIFKGK